MGRLITLSISAQIVVAAFSPYLQIIFRNKGYSHSLCGVLLALCQFAAIIIPLLISSISDKTGKTKSFLLLCSLVSLVTAIPFLLSNNIVVVVIASFILNGVFWSINPLCDGFINRALTHDTSRYGTIRAMGTLSYVCTLVLFAFIKFPNENSNSSILLAMIICILLFIIVLLTTKENSSSERKEKENQVFSISWFSKSFYIFIGIVALTRVGQAVVEKLLSSYMIEELNLGGYFLIFVALGALCEFFCMIFFSRLKRNKKITSWSMLLISAIGLTVRLLLYLIPSIYTFIIAQMLHGLTFGVLHVAATGYAADNVAPEHYDLAMTLYWSLATNLPEMLGAFAGGFVIEAFGYPMLFLSYSIFPLVACILCLTNKKHFK